MAIKFVVTSQLLGFMDETDQARSISIWLQGRFENCLGHLGSQSERDLERGNSTLLVLLTLSVAFDIRDHDTLLEHLLD